MEPIEGPGGRGEEGSNGEWPRKALCGLSVNDLGLWKDGQMHSETPSAGERTRTICGLGTSFVQV